MAKIGDDGRASHLFPGDYLSLDPSDRNYASGTIHKLRGQIFGYFGPFSKSGHLYGLKAISRKFTLLSGVNLKFPWIL